MTREQIEHFARTWRARITAREVLLAGAVVCAVAALAVFWFRPWAVVSAAVAAFIVAFAFRLARSKPWKVDAAHLVRHLNRTFPELEESSVLWLRPDDSLTFVERLQRRRADAAAGELSRESATHFAAPSRDLVRAPAMWFVAALGLLVAIVAWRSAVVSSPRAVAVEPARASAPNAADQPAARAPKWPRIEHADLVITPPGYTNRPERRVAGLNAEAEEGALIKWSIKLDRRVQEAGLRFGAGENEVLRLSAEPDGTLRASQPMNESAVYGLTAVMEDGALWRPHELYSLKVIKDRAPALRIQQPQAARTQIAATTPNPRVTVEVLASDDYAVAEARLVATVAKGTGEAVKFREQTIAFDVVEPTDEVPNGRRLRKTFDLLALGLEPGDELYFHVEATDNREPAANRARSETRFIILQGAEQTTSTPGAGVSGLNLVPQYFRSQRQIIIDTEKLIAEHATLSASEFRDRANNLAIDQQLLRQRYGEFLGEEADHGGENAEVGAAHEQEAHSADDAHDHSHDAAPSAPQTQQEIAAQYGHQHDSQDEATLFDRETKGTMRQALAAMWEAERLLRVAKPQEALAPENRALEIIKQLQQADRSYVQRVGFEAAPIDFAARRLRGDVADVPETITAQPQTPSNSAIEKDIRELLRIAPWRRGVGEISAPELELVRRVEPALLATAHEHAGGSLGALEELRRIAAGEALPQGGSSELERALLRMLGAANRQPTRAPESAPSMAEVYFRNLEQSR